MNVGGNVLFPVKEKERQIAMDEFGFEQNDSGGATSSGQERSQEGTTSEGGEVNPRTSQEWEDVE